MEAASRLAMMAVLTRVGSPQQREEKVTWNGSGGYLPLMAVDDYDVEAGEDGGGEGKRLPRLTGKMAPRRGGGDGGVRSGSGRRRSGSGNGRGAVAGGRGARSGGGGGALEGALWLLLLGLECCLVGGVEGWIVYMAVSGADFGVWNWLSEYATPALMILFSVSFSAALLRVVGCLGRLGDLGFQAAGLVIATFCAVVVCAGVAREGKGRRRQEGEEEAKGERVVVGLAVKMWFLFFIGFWCAVFQWLRDDQEKTAARTTLNKGKRRQRGYGTTSGGLATLDESLEGFVSDL